MTTFKYAAKGPGGKTVEGTINATDKTEAVAELREGESLERHFTGHVGRKSGEQVPEIVGLPRALRHVGGAVDRVGGEEQQVGALGPHTSGPSPR